MALTIGCNRFALDTYWRSKEYRLIAIDAPDQMSLICDAADGATLHLVDSTVFSIGADEKYIVVAQHPSTNGFGESDRSVTRYFVIERIQRARYADREKGVRGPLSKEDFDQLLTTLSLPKFSKTFDDLK